MAIPASVTLGPQARAVLGRLVERLAEKFSRSILEVRLFGSRARGDARPGSDVDLLIVVRDEAPEDLEERIEAERADVWRQDDEYAHLAAFVLQEKHVPVSPAERAAIEEGLRARGMTFDDLLPMLGLLVMREAEFRYHQATRDLLYRSLRDEGIPLWSAGVDLWNEEGVPVIGRERDVRFDLERAGEMLQSARRALEHGWMEGVASEAFYAAFRSARASLLTENIERASHGDLIAEFNRLTKANRLLGKAFHAAQDYCRRWLERREDSPARASRRRGRRGES